MPDVGRAVSLDNLQNACTAFGYVVPGIPHCASECVLAVVCWQLRTGMQSHVVLYITIILVGIGVLTGACMGMRHGHVILSLEAAQT